MTARQIELIELYSAKPQSSNLVRLWVRTMLLQSAIDGLMAEVRQAVGDPSWLVAHMEETNERHVYDQDAEEWDMGDAA